MKEFIDKITIKVIVYDFDVILSGVVSFASVY